MYTRRWAVASTALGVAFTVALLATSTLLKGHKFHDSWQDIGRHVLLATVVLGTAFLWSLGITYVQFTAGRSQRKRIG